MERTCDVCGSELGLFRSFRYADGAICRFCYEKASRHYTETIRTKSLAEVKRLCETKQDVEAYYNFHVTGKIGNYMLIDEKNRKLCLLGNRMTGSPVEEPRFLDLEKVTGCRIIWEPQIPPEEMEQLVKEQRSEQTVSRMEVEFMLDDNAAERIRLITKPVRIRSYAFRQSYRFANRIKDETDRMIGQ